MLRKPVPFCKHAALPHLRQDPEESVRRQKVQRAEGHGGRGGRAERGDGLILRQVFI